MRKYRVVMLALASLAWSTHAQAQYTRVSVSTGGVQGNAASSVPAISGSGRFVAFVSAATNLVADDTNGELDVFLHDRDVDGDSIFDEVGSIATIRASQRPGVQANGPSFDLVITPDGRFVVFTSRATSLFSVAQPPLPYTLVFRYDRMTGDVKLVSQNAEGEPADGICVTPVVSDDGRYVVFLSHARNLVPGDPGFGGGIFLRDVEAGTIVRLSEPQPPPLISINFTQASLVESPTISGDGRLIGFAELVRFVNRGGGGGTTNNGTLTLLDRAAGAVQRAFAPGWQIRLTNDGSAFVANGLRSDPNAEFGVAYRQHLATSERRMGPFPIGAIGGVSPSGRLVQMDGALFHDFRFGSFAANFWQRGVSFDRTDAAMAVSTLRADLLPGGQDSNDVEDIYVVPVSAALDNDADTLPDTWEQAFGLSTINSGASDDPDGDGLTNAQELAGGSHPRGTAVRYLAEGAVGPFFETRLGVANPDSSNPAVAVVRFEKSDGTSVSQSFAVPPLSRVTLHASAEPLLGTADFSTVVESDRPLVVDRLMWWDRSRYGSHAETSSAAPATTWFLAEGTTVLDIQLFYLLQNPGATAATATVRFLRPSGAQIVRTYDLPPHSRTTIHVNTVPLLEASDVSAEVTATQPIFVERAMYRSSPNQVFALGHAAAGIPQAATNWFLAEGATGTFFDTYVLLANPTPQDASVQVDFLRDSGGTVSLTYAVAANSRFTVFADAVPGLEATTFGTRVTSSTPVVVERAMYWPGGFFDYYEGHVSAGTTATGAEWLLAEAEIGGPNAAETFILLANTSSTPVSASIHLLPEVGSAPPTLVPQPPLQPLIIPANSRVSVPLSTLVSGTARVGVLVIQSGGPLIGSLVVEGAIYWNSAGVLWSAGASLPATRLR